MAVPCHTCDFGGGAGLEGTLFCPDGATYTFGSGGGGTSMGSCGACQTYGLSQCSSSIANVGAYRPRKGGKPSWSSGSTAVSTAVNWLTPLI